MSNLLAFTNFRPSNSFGAPPMPQYPTTTGFNGSAFWGGAPNAFVGRNDGFSASCGGLLESQGAGCRGLANPMLGLESMMGNLGELAPMMSALIPMMMMGMEMGMMGQGSPFGGPGCCPQQGDPNAPGVQNSGIVDKSGNPVPAENGVVKLADGQSLTLPDGTVVSRHGSRLDVKETDDVSKHENGGGSLEGYSKITTPDGATLEQGFRYQAPGGATNCKKERGNHIEESGDPHNYRIGKDGSRNHTGDWREKNAVTEIGRPDANGDKYKVIGLANSANGAMKDMYIAIPGKNVSDALHQVGADPRHTQVFDHNLHDKGNADKVYANTNLPGANYGGGCGYNGNSYGDPFSELLSQLFGGQLNGSNPVQLLAMLMAY